MLDTALHLFADTLHILQWGLPADVSRAAVYLASGDTSWVTGQTLSVDGGVSAGIAVPSFDQYGTEGYVLDKRANEVKPTL